MSGRRFVERLRGGGEILSIDIETSFFIGDRLAVNRLPKK